MASVLKTASIPAPGFFGLNTMDSEVTMDPKFARNAENCVIDEGGRLAARKGWQYIAQTDPASTVDLKGLHRFLDIDGAEYFGMWSTDKFYVRNGDTLDEVFVNQHTLTAGSLTSSGTTATVAFTNHNYETGDEIIISGATQTEYNGTYTITKINANSFSYTFAGSATTPATGTITTSLYVDTVGNWQAATLNDAAYLFERGEAPMYFNPTTGELDLIINVNKTISPPQGNTVLSAYGRIWVADTPTNKTTVYWSDLLNGTEWDTNVGTVGSLDISGILVNGNDEIVGLGAHNGNLIIFCKNNIIIMGDTDANKQYLNPADMLLVEVLHGVGCVARDSIVNTGTDIFFLSRSGVRALSRTIQEKSQPMRDISSNVRDTLVAEVAREDEDSIKAVYSDHYGFYLLALPTDQNVYCFDTKKPLPDGAARVTRWNGMTFTGWLSFDSEIYMTHTDGLAQYYGYQDNGEAYQMLYYTNYFDFGMQNIIKIAKNLSATIRGSTGQKFIAKIGTNYESIYSTYNMTVDSGAIYEYNIADFGLNSAVAASTQAADTVTLENTLPAITAATQANPCQITSTAHGLTTGNEVLIENVVGMTELNGNVYTVTVVDANNFTLDSTDSTAYTAYVSGGDLTHLESYTVDFQTTTDSTYNVGYVVWLDSDGYYYALDDGTRTKTTLYTPVGDWSSEYSGSSSVENVRIPVGNSGFVLQLGFESTINGGFLNIQQVDLYVKQGRLH